MITNGVRKHSKAVIALLIFLLAALVGSVFVTQMAEAADTTYTQETIDSSVASAYAKTILGSDVFDFSISTLSSYSYGKSVTGNMVTATVDSLGSYSGVAAGDKIDIFAIDVSSGTGTYGSDSDPVLTLNFENVATIDGKQVDATVVVSTVAVKDYWSTNNTYVADYGDATYMQFIQLYDTDDRTGSEDKTCLVVSNQGSDSTVITASGSDVKGTNTGVSTGDTVNYFSRREIGVTTSVTFTYENGDYFNPGYIYQAFSDLDVYVGDEGATTYGYDSSQTGESSYGSGSGHYQTWERVSLNSGYSDDNEFFSFPTMTYDGVKYYGGFSNLLIPGVGATYSWSTLEQIDGNTIGVTNDAPVSDYLQNDGKWALGYTADGVTTSGWYTSGNYDSGVDAVVRTAILVPLADTEDSEDTSATVSFTNYVSNCGTGITFYAAPNPVGIYLTKEAETTSSYSMSGSVYTLYESSDTTQVSSDTAAATQAATNYSSSTLTTSDKYTIRTSGGKSYFSSDNLNKFWMSSSSGDVVWYYLKETKAVNGYGLDDTIWCLYLENATTSSSSSISIKSGLYKSTDGGTTFTKVDGLTTTTGESITYTITSTEPVLEATLDLSKVDEDNNTVKVAGAEYTLYKGSQWLGTEYTTKVGTYTTDANGEINDVDLTLLNEKTYYYLKETKAPDGYELDDTVWKIRVYSSTAGTITCAVWQLRDGYSENDEVVDEYGDPWYTADYATSTTSASYEKSSDSTSVVFSVTSYEPPDGGYISLVKSSGDSNISSTSVYSTNGATYTVYTNYSCTTVAKDVDGNNATITTETIDGVDGRGLSTQLNAGTYYVKETSASPGFTKDDTVYTVTVTAGDTSSISWSNPSVSSVEPPKTLSFTFYKESDDTSISTTSAYSLAGATYTLYVDDNTLDTSTADVYDTYTTADLGDGNYGFVIEDLPLLPSGSYYYLVETKSSTGFNLDSTVWRLRVSNNSSNEKVIYSVYKAADSSSSFSSVKTTTTVDSGSVITLSGLTSYEPPKSLNITFYKDSEDSSITSGNSSYSLAGATYTLYVDDSTLDTSTADVFGTYTTADLGDGNYGITLENLPTQSSGTYYYLVETKASTGFSLDTTVWRIRVYNSSTEDKVAYNVYKASSTSGSFTFVKSGVVDSGSTVTADSFTSYEPVTYLNFTFYKDSADSTISTTSAYSLAGAEYTLYTNSGLTTVYDNGNNGVYTTVDLGDGNYGITIENLPISSGYYYLAESTPSNGFGFDDTVWRIRVTNSSTDGKVTYNVYKASDASSTFVYVKGGTADSGSTVTADSFTSYEPPKTINLTMYKQSADTSISTTSAYDLGGAVYTLYTSTSSTFSASSATVVTTATTETTTGEFTFSDLSLQPSGTYYYIVETSASAGYSLDTTIWRLTLTDIAGGNTLRYKLEEAESSSGSFTATMSGTKTSGDTITSSTYAVSYEPPEYLNFTFYKASEDSSITSGNSSYSLAGAVYTLYTSTSTTFSTSTATVYNTYTTADLGSNQYGFTISNLPLQDSGTYYYLVETTASAGFGLDDTVWRIRMSDSSTDGYVTYSVYKAADASQAFALVKSATVASGTTVVADSFTSYEPPLSLDITFYKDSTDSTISSTSAYSLIGAEYTLYTDSGLTTVYDNGNNGVYTTADLGSSKVGFTISTLPVSSGYYYLAETKASDGFDTDSTIWRIQVTEASTVGYVTYTISKASDASSSFVTVKTATVASGTAVADDSLTSYEPPKSVDINLTKVSGDSDITDGNNCYSVEGAVYTLYTSTTNSTSTAFSSVTSATVYGTYTTDASGNISIEDLPLSDYNYYLVETTASTGYKVDPTVWLIQVSSVDGTSNVTYVLNQASSDTTEFDPVNRITQTVASGYTISLTSNEPPLDDPAGITITKEPSSTNSTTGGNLAGAQFTIKFYADYYDTVDDLDGVEPTRTWVIETQEEDGEYKAYLNDTFLVSALSDALYYDNGTVVIPLGTVTIEETKVPDGYTTTGDLLDANGDVLEATDGVVLLQITENTNGEVEMTGGNTYTKKEDAQECSITIYKTDGTNALVGAEFQVEMLVDEAADTWETVYFKTETDQTTGESYYVPVADGDSYDDDDAVLVTSGAEGKIVIQKLFFGTYRITETATLDGYTLLAEPVVVTLPVTADSNAATTADPTYTVDGVDYYCDISYHIQNGSVTNPPMTGGYGIGIYLILGSIALAAGLGCAVVVVTRRGKRQIAE